MKTMFSGIVAGVLLCGASLAQDATLPQANDPVPQNSQSPVNAQSAETSSGQSSGVTRIAPGSVIPVQLTKSIDAKKVKTGDEVVARVTQDMKTGNGEIVLSKDAKVFGHIAEAQARNKEQKESHIGIAFDHAVMKNGGDVPLPMSIQAIIAPPSLNGSDSQPGESGGQMPSAPGAGGAASNNGGRSSGMGGGGMGASMPPQVSSSATAGGEGTTGVRTDASGRQPITVNTQGVVGISNLKLSASESAMQGSVVSSEKGNVKLESGTLMLLRVNP